MKLTYLKKEQARFSDCVILLHGLGRTKFSFSKMEAVLIHNGFRVINLDYPSTRKNISVLADETIKRGLEQSQQLQARKIHFVTHSMGGILLRDYLSRNSLDKIGHTVMLSPPNKGSEIVDKLKNNFFFKWILGPAGRELGTDRKSLPARLKPFHHSVGIITGNKSARHDKFFNNFFEGEHDGKVSVSSARLKGMSDFLVLPTQHTFIMSDDAVIKQTLHFIKQGTFKR
ncbi:MAG TPA: alpha/beta fold hydrolase [Aeromonadales bacterium]|nr:alpha/beta fold hydrolase [Aeromonadales bacterium]